MKLLALDTNVFIHGKYFTEVAWNDLAGEPVCLVVPLQVLDELDDLKYAGKTPAIKERAQKVATHLLRLVQASQGDATIRADVFLRIAPAIEGVAAHQLNQDNRILECCAQLGATICTNDTGVVLKAIARKVEYLKLPDDWREPAKPDPEKAELQMLRNRQPKLQVIATANGVLLTEGSVVQLVQPRRASSEEIRMHAYLDAEQAEAARRRRLGDEDGDGGDWLLDEMDRADGNSTARREQALAQAADAWRTEARQLRIMIDIRNDGTNVANDVRVTAEVDAPLEFVGEAPRLTYPKIIHTSSQPMGSFQVQVPPDLRGGRIHVSVHCVEQLKPIRQTINFQLASKAVGPFRS